jgi:hypothetical protein
MKLLGAVVLGGGAAVALPLLLRDAPGAVGRAADYGIIHPIPGAAHLPFSLPVFLFITIFAVLFTSWANR